MVPSSSLHHLPQTKTPEFVSSTYSPIPTMTSDMEPLPKKLRLDPAVIHVAILAIPLDYQLQPLLSLIQKITQAYENVPFKFFRTPNRCGVLRTFTREVAPHMHLIDVPVHLEQTVLSRKEWQQVIPFVDGAEQPFMEALSKRVHDNGPINWVFSSSLLHHTRLIAQNLGAKWLSLWTLGPLLPANCRRSQYLRPNPRPADWLDTSLVSIQELEFNVELLHKIKIRDIPKEIAERQGFFHLVVEGIGRASALVLDMYENFQPAFATWFLNDINHTAYYVGALNVDPAPNEIMDNSLSLTKFLDGYPYQSILVLEIGEELSTAELIAICNGLRNHAIPFMWALHPKASYRISTQVANFGYSGFFDEVLPLNEVLVHPSVAAFVTSCALWSSVMTSIACGVPIISIPVSKVGRLNSQLISAGWKVDLQVRSFNDVDLKALIDQVQNPQGVIWQNIKQKEATMTDAKNGADAEWNGLTMTLGLKTDNSLPHIVGVLFVLD